MRLVGFALSITAVLLVGNLHATPPDVVVITIDDMNNWTTLFDPANPIKTPNIERLASRGVSFSRAYCASPACNPSRVATWTGLRPTTSGVYGNKTDWRRALSNRKTLMQRFRDAGYHVAGAGKIFHHHWEGAFHDDASFDEFQHMRPQLYPAKKLNGAPEYGTKNTDWGVWPQDAKDSIDIPTVDYCVKQLEALPEGRPLFLAVGIFKPHSPFFSPAEYHRPYVDMELPLRNDADWDDLPSGADALMKSKRWFWTGMMSLDSKRPGSYHDFIKAYAACCAFADAQVGRVLDALDATERGRKAIVVLWSDHGFHLGEKDHIEKFMLWEKSTHIPLIFVAPGAKPDAKCGRPVDMTCLYPTLLELCNLPADPVCDGASIVPLLNNPNAMWGKPALMSYMSGNHAIRTERWRYIRYADGSEELYDHANDPHEWTNLADQPEHRERITQLAKAMPTSEASPVPDMKQPSN